MFKQVSNLTFKTIEITQDYTLHTGEIIIDCIIMGFHELGISIERKVMELISPLQYQ